MDYALYIASTLGAVALFMMMPRRGFSAQRIGVLLGAATLGGLWLALWRNLGGQPAGGALSGAAFAYYYVFSALAIGSAARVITHTRPVYAALWFVMVVLSSAGLFLVLDAEFMAFAMIIIYGGAILVTYLFVIMLAAHAGDPEAGDESPAYDRVAREPAAAVVAGFLLLAMLLSAAFAPLSPNPAAAADSDEVIIATVLGDRPEHRLLGRVPDSAARQAAADSEPLANATRVGLDLFRANPLGLELAGVILLVALVGAVVIARQRADQTPAAESEMKLE